MGEINIPLDTILELIPGTGANKRNKAALRQADVQALATEAQTKYQNQLTQALGLRTPEELNLLRAQVQAALGGERRADALQQSTIDQLTSQTEQNRAGARLNTAQAEAVPTSLQQTGDYNRTRGAADLLQATGSLTPMIPDGKGGFSPNPVVSQISQYVANVLGIQPQGNAPAPQPGAGGDPAWLGAVRDFINQGQQPTPNKPQGGDIKNQPKSTPFEQLGSKNVMSNVLSAPQAPMTPPQPMPQGNLTRISQEPVITNAKPIVQSGAPQGLSLDELMRQVLQFTDPQALTNLQQRFNLK